jgi:CHAT domain-containing protein
MATVKGGGVQTGRDDPGPDCPHSESLAAYVDGHVEAAERLRIQSHLAGCDDCRFLIAQAIYRHGAYESQVDGPGGSQIPEPRVAAKTTRPQPVMAAPSPRRLMRWGVAAVLATAAALFVLVQVQPSWLRAGLTGGAERRLADLADAVGQERTVEARLTGGFRYSPMRATVRSGGSLAPLDNWPLYATAGRIREDVQQDPSPINVHALGVAHLLLGEYDEAVQALEDAIAEDATNGRFQADVSAAYLARARALERPDDLPRALGAAERAIAADPSALEPRFNRALALQALSLRDPARRAWEEYLSRDSTSGWAEEARRNLAALQTSDVGPVDPARNNSPPVTDVTVEAGLAWVLRHGLASWADGILTHDPIRATAQQSLLSAYTEQLASVSGDPFLTTLAALPSAEADDAPAVAESLRAIAHALMLVDADEIPAAESELRTACPHATAPVTRLCDAEIGLFDVIHRADGPAAQRADALRRSLATAPATYIEARLNQLEAFRALFHGDYSRAGEFYRKAFDNAQQGKYVATAATTAAQVADISSLLGIEVETWRWRRLALAAADQSQSAKAAFAARLAAGWDLSRNGNHEAARAFLNSDLGSSLQRVPALLSQARAALAAGDHAAATEAVTHADRVVASSTDFRARRLEAEVLALTATLAWQQGDLARSKQTLRAAIDAMGPERSAQRAAILLQRVAILSSAQADLNDAETDAVEAIDTLTRTGSSPQGVPIDSSTATAAIASLIAAKADLQGARGLAMTESLRQLLGGFTDARLPPSTPAALQELADRLPAGRAAIVLVFTDRSLLSWTMTTGSITFADRPITPRDVEQRVATLAVQVARSPGRQELWTATLEDLFDLLLRDLPGVAEATDLLIVPDGPLGRVPFSSLIDRRSGKFVFDGAAVRLAPSLLYGVREAPSPSAGATVLSIGAPELKNAGKSGLPRLPRAREEALLVAAMYPHARTLVGPSATKERVMGDLENVDVLHFAGHALVSNARAPRLLLAGSVTDPAAALSVGDLNGHLGGMRVVLAGCETAASAAGDRSTSRTHLASAFLRAGASSVVGSLWKVDDAVAEQFFTEVHRRLAKGQSAAVAVAGAQRQCRRAADCRRNPATWIGATVYGMH